MKKALKDIPEAEVNDNSLDNDECYIDFAEPIKRILNSDLSLEEKKLALFYFTR